MGSPPAGDLGFCVNYFVVLSGEPGSLWCLSEGPATLSILIVSLKNSGPFKPPTTLGMALILQIRSLRDNR